MIAISFVVCVSARRNDALLVVVTLCRSIVVATATVVNIDTSIVVVVVVVIVINVCVAVAVVKVVCAFVVAAGSVSHHATMRAAGRTALRVCGALRNERILHKNENRKKKKRFVKRHSPNGRRPAASASRAQPSSSVGACRTC